MIGEERMGGRAVNGKGWMDGSVEKKGRKDRR